VGVRGREIAAPPPCPFHEKGLTGQAPADIERSGRLGGLSFATLFAVALVQ
jgi:hypothetical protein